MYLVVVGSFCQATASATVPNFGFCLLYTCLQNFVLIMENSLLSQMEELINSKFNAFEQRISANQRELSQSQLASIQQSIGATDDYTFRKKGHEQQHKVNGRVLDSLRQADGFIQEFTAGSSADPLDGARNKIAEGISILTHRQKCTKLADSSEHGWRMVQEYVSNPLADDEKRIQRAHIQADRKVRQERRTRSRRFQPYPSASEISRQTPEISQGTVVPGRKPVTCFSCGKSGHWRAECRMATEAGHVEKGSQISRSCNNLHLLQEKQKFLVGNESVKSELSSHIETPVGRLKSRIDFRKSSCTNSHILDVIEYGYKLPFVNIPCKAELKNNKSAIGNQDFVSEEIEKLLGKGCIRQSLFVPSVVNPLYCIW